MVAVHGGQKDPVGDRAQQFGLAAEVPVEAAGLRLTDARAITSPDVWLRLPSHHYWR
ncbi:hypothetical protein ABZV14_43795 [Streptosporangium canum]